MMVLSIHAQILLGGFVIAMTLGVVVSKTHFCTLGAVSDWINMGDSARLRAWFLAMSIAMLGVLLLEGLEIVVFAETRPPYRSADFAWIRYLLGGLMFGVGMSLSGGCTTKNLTRLGNGNLKSLLVLLVVGICAYLMTKTDFYALAFHSWLQPLSINLSALDLPGQDLGSMLAAVADPQTIRLTVGGMLAVLILILVLASADFRRNRSLIFGGLLVGLCVTGGWYLTGGTWGQQWQEAITWMDEPPQGVGVQSYTFVNPMGELLAYLSQPNNTTLVTFGVVAVAGTFLGALLHALVSRRFRLEWFASWADLLRHLLGAILMGIGGVLAMGCTIGQGITGVSTLALGSFMALGAIILGSATTMKVQYYKMLYEDASLLDALLSGWADLHLLPQSLRRLEAL